MSIADEIDWEYKLKKKYAGRRAQRCKDRKCAECELKDICTESERREE